MFFNRFQKPNVHASFLSLILTLILIVFLADSLFLGLSEYIKIHASVKSSMAQKDMYGACRVTIAATENTCVIL